MGPSFVKKYGDPFYPRSIRIPSENPNLAKHPFGGRGRAGPGRPVRGPGPQMHVLPSLGSQMVRGWNADGTQMERGWNADSKNIHIGTRMERGFKKISIFFDN